MSEDVSKLVETVSKLTDELAQLRALVLKKYDRLLKPEEAAAIFGLKKDTFLTNLSREDWFPLAFSPTGKDGGALRWFRSELLVAAQDWRTTRQIKKANAETDLYRHFDAEGRLLYVGIAIDAGKRSKQHQWMSSWFEKVSRTEVERHPNRAAALRAEREAIRTEAPIHNIQGRPR